MVRIALVAAALLALAAPAAADPTPPRLFADSRIVPGDRITVEVVGQGPDVVLIPGLSSSRETWRATAVRLKDHYRLHLVQVDGFAGEPAQANASGPVLVPVAEAIDAYIRKQGLAPAVVVGHSLGGTITLWLAEHHPQDLRKALVVDALPFFAAVMMGPGATPERVTPMAEALRHAPPQPADASAKMLGALVTAPDNLAMVSAWSRASDPATVQNALADDLEMDLRPDLAAIKTPIVLLYPDNVSLGAPPGAMDGLYKAAFAPAPSVRPVRIDGSRHFIMLDQPAAFAAQLDAFLAPP
jgi:pimeloyl-ACP methyl ester carboxylesterase